MADYRPTREIRLNLKSEHPVRVTHLDTPPKIDRPKKIHRRHLLPLVKEGKEREFHSNTPPLALTRSTPMAVGGAVVLVRDVELTSPGVQDTASNVGEPSAAINGEGVFYT